MAKAKKEETTENIIPVNKDKTYGIAVEPNRLNVIIYSRKLYKQDTQVPTRFDKEVGYKFYKAGDYSAWALAPKPYKPDLVSAIMWVAEMMLQDSQEGSQSLDNIVGDLKSIKDDLETTISKVKWKKE